MQEVEVTVGGWKSWKRFTSKRVLL